MYTRASALRGQAPIPRAIKGATRKRGAVRSPSPNARRGERCRRRGGAHIRTQRIHATRKHGARTGTHSRRKHVARNATRTDGAQHVTKRRQRGQIRVLWSKSINDATARLSCKIGALQAAKRRKGATRARATRKGGATRCQRGRGWSPQRKAKKYLKMIDGGGAKVI